MLRARLAHVRESDTGATIVFVAVILVALLAMSAFAIDFGRMWEERRQLQNGADAAAVAIAEDCVRGLCDGSYDEYAVAPWTSPATRGRISCGTCAPADPSPSWPCWPRSC